MNERRGPRRPGDSDRPRREGGREGGRSGMGPGRPSGPGGPGYGGGSGYGGGGGGRGRPPGRGGAGESWDRSGTPDDRNRYGRGGYGGGWSGDRGSVRQPRPFREDRPYREERPPREDRGFREDRPRRPDRVPGPPRAREWEEEERFPEASPRLGRPVVEDRTPPVEEVFVAPPEPLSGAEFASLLQRVEYAAGEVHSALGPGLHEMAYQRAFEVELSENRIEFSREVRVPVLYKAVQIDMRSIDFLIDGVQIEVKARPAFETADRTQATSYMRASGYSQGIIVNFGDQLTVLPLVAETPAPAEAAPAEEEPKPKRRRTTRKTAEPAESPEVQ